MIKKRHDLLHILKSFVDDKRRHDLLHILKSLSVINKGNNKITELRKKERHDLLHILKSLVGNKGKT